MDNHLLRQRQLAPSDIGQRYEAYPALAEQSMQDGLPGSSTQGEHPKFAVTLIDRSEIRHVLVKFSPPVDTLVGQRWSDLLVAEHHALETLSSAGISSAKSRLLQLENRTYLEVDRFDRVGLSGRIGVTSLLAIDASLYGALDNWIESARRLHQDRRIDIATLEDIKLISTFADLIANTDKHFGNLSFYDGYDGRFRLTPIYDMLPMLFAPAHEQLITRIYVPADPSSATLSAWPRARWRRITGERLRTKRASVSTLGI